ncbi:MAG: class I SAM-dependent RNA methyltransferase [Chitinivibrionia bacterium]|nr:class I SAM-dependent RNA methyltransferase [Chitinivibrionia bacterium]
MNFRDDDESTAASSGGSEALNITSIIAGGDGLARRSDGCVVFVPRSAPGDTVEVEYTELHRQWRRARILRVLEPGPGRCDPPCPYYARCGGCQLQHLRYDAQLAVKTSIIAESLRRLGGFDVPQPDIAASELEFGYRNRLSLVLKHGADGIAAGYHSFDDPGAIIDVDRCPLGEAPINKAWAAVRTLWMHEPERMPGGTELRLTLRANAAGNVGLAIEGASAPGEIERFPEAAKELAAVWLLNDRGSFIRRAGLKTLNERWGSWEIQLAGTAFMQVNRGAARHLHAHVLEQCGDVQGASVVDAYCGFGMHALELSKKGADTVGIDMDRHAVKEASRIAQLAGLAARFIAGGVERVLHRELPADIVILNPPRRATGIASSRIWRS